MDYPELAQLGLLESEVKVYLCLLKLGNSKVEEITQHVSLPRTTIYGILKSLANKGIVSNVIKSGVKYFSAIEPEQLIQMQKEKILALERIAPTLESMKGSMGKKPSLEMFEGKPGIKKIYEDMLKTKQTIYGFGSTESMNKLLEFHTPGYVYNRIHENIFFYLLTEKSKEAIEFKRKDKSSKRETRFIKNLSDLHTATYIYGDKVATLILIKEESFAILVNNIEFAKSQKIIFDLLWKNADKS